MNSWDIYNNEAKVAGNSQPSTPEESPTDAFPPGSAEDLEIEKKWLLLARIDPEKFEFFFDKYHDRIFHFAFWRTGDEELAADITNTVFAVAWQKLSKFRWQGYTFGAWLFQLARGEIANALRKRRNWREQEFQAGEDDRPDGETPEKILEQKSDQDLINNCLDRMNKVRHEIFVLHYWVGLRTNQVATVMKIPPSTVRSHLRRGRRELLDCLAGNQDGLSDGMRGILRQLLLEDRELHLVERGRAEQFGEERDD